MAEAPRFRRPRAPPDDRARLGAMALLMVVAAALLALRAWWPAPTGGNPVVVEVRGEVPRPGFHAVDPPARARAALAAAGADPARYPDAALEPGTRLVVDADGYRVERMDELLVFGLPIDLNTAGETALATVPGIGPRRAAAIVADREARGPFASVDDLDRVRGIGPATVEKLRPFVTVGE